MSRHFSSESVQNDLQIGDVCGVTYVHLTIPARCVRVTRGFHEANQRLSDSVFNHIQYSLLSMSLSISITNLGMKRLLYLKKMYPFS